MRVGLLMTGFLVCLLMANCTPDSRSENNASLTAYAPEGAVLPSEETIKSGAYRPLSRPLYLYVNKSALKQSATAALLRYYLSDEGNELVSESGYIQLDASTHAEQKKLLEDALKEVGATETKEVSGEVMIDGSSTVAPITTAVAEEFSRTHTDVRVPVGTSGTGGGFKKFCASEIDICEASRPIKDSEKELCEKAGIEYLELVIAQDGLTVVVHPKNNWVNGLTVADLKKIWEPQSTVQKWSDLNPEFPDHPIKLFGPDTDSGTFEYFTEEICNEKGASRSDYQQSGDDNFLVSGVANDEYAIGYFGFAYYAENQTRLKALSIAP